ncbi:MAG: hypothetical protein A2189_06185 [Paenibacillus sp. RIFOXYA1_FULL_44_5]|nr:MAG: hypothetical protein A2189_06185 [Paenibacillus sp. RIFOXYA1_FULL_44_5]
MVHTGTGMTWIGRAGEAAAERTVWSGEKAAAELTAELAAAGFPSSYTDDLRPKVWNKLLINAVINPLTAILNTENGKLLESFHTLQLMQALLAEGLEAAASEHIEIADDLWEQLESVCRKTSKNHSSMLQDIRAGRKTEIDWITGSLLAIANKNSLHTPTHQAIYRIVKGLEEISANVRENNK